ncbi:MAG: hypothetical protein HUJ98_04350 [Bacteroidaceae bacterium]|nr:hypothetical protein [Bacteroidaceae bacterium]
MYYRTEEIELSGQKLPYRIDNYVLQAIQEQYDSIVNFECLLMGWKQEGREVKLSGAGVSLTALNFILPEMIREGYACKDMTCEFSDAEIIRMVDMPPQELANIIHAELVKSMVKKKEVTSPKQTAPKRTRKKETTE